MLKVDEQLYDMAQGNTGEKLERAVEMIVNEATSIWGVVLPLELLLVGDQLGIRMAYSIAKKNWGEGSTFFQALDGIAQERLIDFFSPDNMAKFEHYIALHPTLKVDDFISFVVGRELQMPNSHVLEIMLHKVGEQWLVHTIFLQDELFWRAVYAKKLYSLFKQAKLWQIEHPLKLMQELRDGLQLLVSKNRAATIIHQLIAALDQNNNRSFPLKQLHLMDVVTHFTSGRRHFLKLKKRIAHIKNMWSDGKWALTEKEKTLLAYLLLNEAASRKDTEQIVQQGLFLIEDDRLNNHAVELMLEYSDALTMLKPQPHAIVKVYNENYVEFVFYTIIHALVQKQQYKQVLKLLKEHEIASSTAIYNYLNAPSDPDLLHKIEANVQQDIAYIVHGSPQHMRHSLDVWLAEYMKKTSPYAKIAQMTSKHLCNILKSLWATEQFELFEKLMEIYKKYLFIDSHFEQLRTFVAAIVHSRKLTD
ncbi:Fe-S-cluster redox enzyme [Solibacillus sp. CAU 1738]|uniref:Fe-S-cluster redox enzyme n=1 Tax=Solibacillus sp. CAU 1738 TaxID=3140363 RepID=UPI003260353E